MKLRKWNNCYQQQSSLVLQEAGSGLQIRQISLAGGVDASLELTPSVL